MLLLIKTLAHLPLSMQQTDALNFILYLFSNIFTLCIFLSYLYYIIHSCLSIFVISEAATETVLENICSFFPGAIFL